VSGGLAPLETVIRAEESTGAARNAKIMMEVSNAIRPSDPDKPGWRVAARPEPGKLPLRHGDLGHFEDLLACRPHHLGGDSDHLPTPCGHFMLLVELKALEW